MSAAVSVVIATYNYGRYLGAALESVRAQTRGDWETLVVDDGSTDGTPEVVRPYLDDPRIRYLRTAHLGQPAAKNEGIRRTQAPLVAFLDADDRWYPDKLERQLALFQTDPELGVAYSRRRVIDPDGRLLEFREAEMHRGEVLGAIFRTNFVCFSSSMVRRAVFATAGVFDERLPLAIDYDLWLRAALRFRFDYVDAPLVEYRTGHANLSVRTVERLRGVLGIQRRFLEQYGTRAGLDPAVVQGARAETLSNLALACRTRSRLAALGWYARALACMPSYGPAWRGLASLPLPEAVRRGLRRALGRPVDWSVRRPLEASPA